MTEKDDAGPVLYGESLLTEDDLYLFNEGSHLRLYEKMGGRLAELHGRRGASFAVWAPNAERVSVMGDFNGWNKESHPLRARGASGIWEGFIPGLERGTVYKYRVVSRYDGYQADKADPYANFAETAPRTGSVLWDLGYEWGDGEWMAERGGRNSHKAPVSIYEVHLGSWKKRPDDPYSSLSYRELAEELTAYVKDTGFTHVELLPVMEHPLYRSWGYQTLGFFAPTSRFGTPQDFMFLVDRLHQAGIGVILDWVPAHFPSDEHGLGYFDGTYLYEHAEIKQRIHPDWKSLIFNYGRDEVRSFLLSSALFWLDKFHADGLRVDAVASMLYLDYSREGGDWVPNQYGGRENLEAISLIRRFNEEIYRHYPDVQTFAEESTDWPMVSRPTYVGGLGFGMKWDMGWMHDTLDYLRHDPIHRKFHHNQLTFRMMYAFHENFVMPLSHDEVVHGKGSLIGKMPGDEQRRFANLRLLYSYMYAQPGKKLLFMGGEFGQYREWNQDASLEWFVLQYPHHAGLQNLVRHLNRIYRDEPALHELDFDPRGFEWIDCNDWRQSVLTMMRCGSKLEDSIIVGLNFTPVPRDNYRVGAPCGGRWREIFNSDALEFGGGGQGNLGGVDSHPVSCHGRPHTLNILLPPLGAVFFKRAPEE